MDYFNVLSAECGPSGYMEKEEFYGEKGEKMKVSFEWRKGENDDFAAVFSLMETT